MSYNKSVHIKDFYRVKLKIRALENNSYIRGELDKILEKEFGEILVDKNE